jgi:1-deoxy-D-xylulose-5-phosphate synthase
MNTNFPAQGGATPILSGIKRPGQVAKLSPRELTALAAELRSVIIDTVSRVGGHLAPSLGVIELTLALFHTFDFEKDKVVWDVGHQAYAHKLLTGRLKEFHTLRQYGGVSGFPRMAESPYDHFGVGHSSTSISAALGMSMARDLRQKDHNVVAVIGDGSMTAGMAYEGLNQAGHMDRNLIVVLNDNGMSISKNVGALSSFLSRNISHPKVAKFKKDVGHFLRQIPLIGDELAEYAKRSDGSFKAFFTPGMLFEAFDFNYMGPFDGHNVEGLCEAFSQVKELRGPILVHVQTIKGKGYNPAMQNPTYFHGVGKFTPETGQAQKYAGQQLPTYTEVFGKTLCRMAARDKRIVAITAAMPEGTGTDCFRETHPDRFVDVGICEQHAVTFAAGMATQGFKPAVAIYSTFLQRSYDQIVHDVCLQNLPVKLFLDRGGLVGEDGGTHHGVFDLSFLRHIPNLVLMAPKDEAELQRMMATAFAHPGPVAVRYPRGVGTGAALHDDPEPLPLGQGELLRDGVDGVIVAIGSRVYPAMEAAEEIQAEEGLDYAVFNARFVKPLPGEDLAALAGRFPRMLLAEENALAGGFGSAVLEFLADRDLLSGRIVRRIGIADQFVEHGAPRELRAKAGIDKRAMKEAIRALSRG